MKKTKSNASYFFAFVIFVLIGLAVGIGLMNILYWESVVPNNVFKSGAESNVESLITMLSICLLCWWYVENTEGNGKTTRYYYALPLMMIVTKVLMECGFGLTSNGKTWWLGVAVDGYNYDTISYFTLMLIPTIVAVPRAINSFVNMNYEYEKLIISIYAAGISLMSILLFGEMKGAFICGGFILGYYMLRSGRKNRWIVFIPYIIVILFGAFYGVNGKLSTFYVTETFNRLIGRDVNMYSFSSNQLWYLKEYSTMVGLVALLVIYVLIIVLLLIYILKYIKNNERRTMALYLWFTMTVMWVFAVVGNMFIDFNLSFNAPFMAKNSYIWLLFIITCISLKNRDWNESLEYEIDSYFNELGYEPLEDERLKGGIAYGHKLDEEVGILITVKQDEEGLLHSRIIFIPPFSDDKELDVYRIINKNNRFGRYNCHMTENKGIMFIRIDNINIPNCFDIMQWFDEFDDTMIICERMYNEIKALGVQDESESWC